MKFLLDNRKITDTAVNLALEEFAMRNLDISNDYVAVYRNSPSVVIGRHQNIYEEADIVSARKLSIDLMRRISGGGAVYHDQGNINFSFITQYEKFKFNNYDYFNQPVITALRKLGVPAEMNGRNDIVSGNVKISGNAQFTSKDRMVSHGTLLFEASLEDLKKILHAPQRGIQSRAIKSVRSKVANISDLLSQPWNIDDFQNYLLENIFSSENGIPLYSFNANQWKEIRRLAEEKYRKWDWIFGESPIFTFRNKIRYKNKTLTAEMEIKKGMISRIEIKSSSLSVEYLTQKSESLLECRYDPEILQRRLVTFRKDSIPLKIWLKLLFPVPDGLS